MPSAFSESHQPIPFSVLRDGLRAVVGAKVPPITLRQFAVMLCLENADAPLGTEDLATDLNLQKPTITRICDRLQPLGYISRVVNPADARMRLIELMPKGRTLLEGFHTGMTAASTKSKPTK